MAKKRTLPSTRHAGELAAAELAKVRVLKARSLRQEISRLKKKARAKSFAERSEALVMLDKLTRELAAVLVQNR